MSRSRTTSAVSVERFFQFSLLGLVTSGFLALAGSGYLDRATLILTFCGLLLRGLGIAGVVRLRLTPQFATAAACAYLVFLPVDYYVISRDFLTATVHGVCFLAVAKILTAQTSRDYAFTGVISFIELIAAALLSAQSSFFGYLMLYVVFAIASFTSGEIHGALGRAAVLKARVEGPRDGRLPLRLVAIACGSTAAIILMTVGLFFAVPRTARLTARFLPSGARLTGFSNVVDLGGFGSISKDDRAVMHVRSYSRALPPDVKWRGAALSRFDGRRWWEPRALSAANSEIPAAPRVAVVADRLQLSRRDGRRLLYSVDLTNSGTGTLFLAGIPEFINIDTQMILGTPAGGFRAPAAPRQTLRYQVSSFWGPQLAQSLTPAERARYLQFPATDLRIVSLARAWAGEGTAFERARRIQSHLQHDFRYVLDGPATPVAEPLADFLFVRKEGYCEYFASAMAVMLRSLGIPSRVATGFEGGYLNDITGLYVVRASDAHAWVEAFLPDERREEEGSWTTFDPTPAASEAARQSALVSRLSMYFEAADAAWQEWVVSYDLGHQAVAAAQFESALRRLSGSRQSGRGGWRSGILPALKGWGGWLLVGLFAAVLCFFFGPDLWKLWQRRARVRRVLRAGGSPADATLLYEQMLERFARRGFHKPPAATPTEFAAHLEKLATPAEARIASQFTELYNTARFGGDVPATARLAALLREFTGAV